MAVVKRRRGSGRGSLRLLVDTSGNGEVYRYSSNGALTTNRNSCLAAAQLGDSAANRTPLDGRFGEVAYGHLRAMQFSEPGLGWLSAIWKKLWLFWVRCYRWLCYHLSLYRGWPQAAVGKYPCDMTKGDSASAISMHLYSATLALFFVFKIAFSYNKQSSGSLNSTRCCFVHNSWVSNTDHRKPPFSTSNPGIDQFSSQNRIAFWRQK